MEARCDDADQLARCAFHLGNRHTPVEVRDGALRFAADDVLAGMLRGLGATRRARSRAPFEPEAGAYAAGHHHHSGEAKHTRHHPRHDRTHADESVMRDPLALVRLLQLASPALPIGAYSYSQGLEWCVEAGERSTMPRPRRRGSAICSRSAGARRSAGAVAACARCARAAIGTPSRAGTRGSARRARRRSCWPRRCRWAAALARLLADLDVARRPLRATH